MKPISKSISYAYIPDTYLGYLLMVYLLGVLSMVSYLLRALSQKITVIWIQITVIFNEVAPCGANEGMQTLRE